MLTEKTITFLPYLQLNGRPVRPLRNADGERARAQALRAGVELVRGEEVDDVLRLAGAVRDLTEAREEARIFSLI